MVTVETGARLHFGFQNLSLAHERLYGGIGVGLQEPRVRVDVAKADDVRCTDDGAREYVERVAEVLDVPGADVTVEERFDRHVGLGSGTQLALACLVGTATAYDLTVDPRTLAPDLGRGGRSGVGVTTFENGGFVVDAGHRTERYTSRPPEPGHWTVPRPIVRRTLPADWRFLLVTPETTRGCSGDEEESSMESVVEGASPGVAEDIAAVLTRVLLPAVAESNIEQFGEAVERIGRLNGAWYADEQGGLYRPPAGALVEGLRDSTAVDGVGQSSWGPTVYGVTDATRIRRAKQAGEGVLETCGLTGTVRVVEPGVDGYRVRP